MGKSLSYGYISCSHLLLKTCLLWIHVLSVSIWKLYVIKYSSKTQWTLTSPSNIWTEADYREEARVLRAPGTSGGGCGGAAAGFGSARQRQLPRTHTAAWDQIWAGVCPPFMSLL